MGSIRLAPDHTRDIFDKNRLPELVDQTIKELMPYNVEGIMVSGHSGLVIGGAISYVGNLHLIAVRKEGDEQHCQGGSTIVNATMDGPLTRWAWVDDFICSGRTFKYALQQAMKMKAITTAVPTCIISYRGYDRESWRADKQELEIASRYNVLSTTTIPHIGFRNTT